MAPSVRTISFPPIPPMPPLHGCVSFAIPSYLTQSLLDCNILLAHSRQQSCHLLTLTQDATKGRKWRRRRVRGGHRDGKGAPTAMRFTLSVGFGCKWFPFSFPFLSSHCDRINVVVRLTVSGSELQTIPQRERNITTKVEQSRETSGTRGRESRKPMQ